MEGVSRETHGIHVNMSTSINVRLTDGQLKALDDLATKWRKETGENFNRSRVVRILIEDAHTKKEAKKCVNQPPCS